MARCDGCIVTRRRWGSCWRSGRTGDDVSTMNARGGVERGWAAVRDRWTWWASQGVPMEAEPDRACSLSSRAADIACSVALEHHATRTLRVTHGYRREDGEWRLVHRHADPLVGRQG